MSILERIDRMMAAARIQGFLPSEIHMGKKEQVEIMAELDAAKPFIVFDHRGAEVQYRGAAVAFTQEPTQLRLESVMLSLEEVGLLSRHRARPLARTTGERPCSRKT